MMKRIKNMLFFADGIVEDSPALRRAHDLASLAGTAGLAELMQPYQSEDQMIYTQTMIGTAFINNIRAVMHRHCVPVIRSAHPSPSYRSPVS